LIPLKDDNPTRIVPFVTIGLIAANVVVFVFELTLPPEALKAFVGSMGVIPAELTRLMLHDPRRLPHAGMTLFTAMFVHGGLMHVAMNMLYLWIFGNNIEDVMGHGRYLAFYLACGLVASFCQVAVAPDSQVPMIGASGAISGILGAYVIMFPAARVMTLVFFIFFIRVVPIPAVIVLGVWFLLQLLNAGPAGTGGGVAVFAHIGGFLAGVALIAGFRRRRSRQSLF